MRGRKKSIDAFFVFLTAFVLFCGCASEVQKARAVPTEKPLTVTEKIEISLDDAPPDSAPLLTRNIYFIFDGSGSMAKAPDKNCGGEAEFGSKLEGAKWAVAEFMKKVPEDINIGLYVFDALGKRETVPLGPGNHRKFLEAINNVKASGKTPLAASIKFAADRLVEQYKRQLGYGEYRIVAVTDGIAENIPEAAAYAAQRGIPIYAIGLCIKEDHPLRKWAVSYRAADNFEDLARGLEETLAESTVFDATEFN